MSFVGHLSNKTWPEPSPHDHVQWKSSSSFRKRAPVKEPGEDQKQVLNSNGGLFVLTTNVAGTGIPSTRGEASQQRIMSFQKSCLSPCKKKHVLLLIPDSSRLVSQTHLPRPIWVGHVPPTPYLFNWHRKTQLTPSHPTKMPKLHPQAVSHTLSGVMKVSPNGMTSQPPTPLLWNWTFFLSPLWEHFGSQMGLPDLFGDLDWSHRARWSRWWCHCQRNPRSQVSPKKTSDFKLFGTRRTAPIFAHFLRSHDVEAPVGGFRVSSQHSKCDIRDIPWVILVAS